MLELTLLAAAAVYAAGIARLWTNAGAGRGISRADAARFAAGWLALAAALVGPLDAIAERSFALHMVQHELLMVVAAPLLVLGRPLEAWTWAMPAAILRGLAAAARAPMVARAWSWLTEPAGAWIFHAAALWSWHLPLFFAAAVASPPLHVLQHASFFASALCFWWSVLGRGVRASGATSMASLFGTMLHTSLLGALLAFAPAPWYGNEAAWLGLTALEDQQLGGLVMWVPGGLPYLAAALAIAWRWLRAPARPRSRTADSPAPT